MGLVYLIQMGDTDYFKIGVTDSDALQRTKTLQTGCPLVQSVVATYEQPNPYRVEREVHELLQDYRFRNEWFSGPKDRVEQLFHLGNAMARLDAELGTRTATEPPFRTAKARGRVDRERKLVSEAAASRPLDEAGAREVRTLIGRGASKTEAIRLVFGATGGDRYRKVCTLVKKISETP
jgi:hypothetical protein